jgi:hypothetical protein
LLVLKKPAIVTGANVVGRRGITGVEIEVPCAQVGTRASGGG